MEPTSLCLERLTLIPAQIAVYEHVVAKYDFSFVLKTDDDSFVNVPALVADLRGRCTAPGCHNERLYMGYQVGHVDATCMLAVL